MTPSGYPIPMHRRLTIAALALGMAAAVLAAHRRTPPPASAPQQASAGQDGWTEADKTGFGTAGQAEQGLVHAQGGRVSEVFYPDLSTPSVRSLELTWSTASTRTARPAT